DVLLSRRPWLQLRPAPLVPRGLGQARPRAHARLLPQARGLIVTPGRGNRGQTNISGHIGRCSGPRKCWSDPGFRKRLSPGLQLRREEALDGEVALARVVVEAEHARALGEFLQLLVDRGEGRARRDADEDAFLA